MTEVPYGTIGAVAVAGGGVAGLIYLGYKYFVEPGAMVLAHYRFILDDIYKETKQFLQQNANLDPPIFGLTAGQEQIILAKETALERIRPQVEEILQSRGIDIQIWGIEIIRGIIIASAAVATVSILVDKLIKWKKEPSSTNIQSSHGHSYILHEILTNEMAELGHLNIASGFLTTMQNHYSVFTQPTLNAGISYYNTLIPTLAPGTMAYLVATQMLTYYTTEISATAGIMGVLCTFWVPPLI